MSPRSRLAFIEPASPKLVDRPPAGPGWIHEIKHDGFRTQVIIEEGKAQAFSKGGNDWSERYAPIVAAAAKLKVKSAIIDGEVIVPDERGASNFHEIHSAIHHRRERLVFIAFDLLHLDGEDLRNEPLSERRAKLRKLIPARNAKLAFSEGFEGEGADVFAAVDAMGLEGIVSKKLTSPYRSGNKTSWRKVKCYAESTLSVVGVDKTRTGAPVALLADGNTYRGEAFINLPAAQRDKFWSWIEKGQTPKAVLLKGLTKRKTATFIKPGLSARVRHLRGEEMLRHASVKEVIGKSIRKPVGPSAQ